MVTGKNRVRNGNTATRDGIRKKQIRNKQEEVRNQMLYNQEQLQLQQEEQRNNDQFMLQMLQ